MNSGVDVFFILIIHLFHNIYGDVVQDATCTNYFADFCLLHLDSLSTLLRVRQLVVLKVPSNRFVGCRYGVIKDLEQA